MKVCFILPPMPFLGDPKRNAPLGVLYLAAACEKAKHEVTVVDWRDHDGTESLESIPEADVYGFTATTPEYPHAVALAKRLRAIQRGRGEDNGPRFVLGGVHATALPYAVDRVFDFTVTGEGEWTLIELLDKIAYDPYGARLGVHHGQPVEDISNQPWPARHLLPEDSFVSTDLCEKGKRATTITASRGCAHACAFCASNVMWGHKVRYRPPRDVMMEALTLRAIYGVEQLRFQDDSLTTNFKWLAELCEEMPQTGMQWRCGARIDTISRGVLAVLAIGGCTEVCFGIESVEQHVLDRCNKRTKVAQAREALAAAHAAEIKSRAFFIIGLPGQGERTADETIKFIEETRPDAVDISTFVPFPGSDIYRQPEHYGIKLKPVDWSDYVIARGLFGDEQDKEFVFEHDVLSDGQLRAQRTQLLEYVRDYNLVRNA